MIKSLFLTAEPSYLYGAARVLDIGAVFDVHNASSSGNEADARAIYADWKMVGDDLRECAYEPR